MNKLTHKDISPFFPSGVKGLDYLGNVIEVIGLQRDNSRQHGDTYKFPCGGQCLSAPVDKLSLILL